MNYFSKSQNTDEEEVYNMGLFFDLSPDLLCISGFDGYFKKLNPAFIKLLGYSEEILYNKPIDFFIFDDDLSVTTQSRQNIISGNPLLNFENRYMTKDDEIIWLSWTSVPVNQDKVIYAIAKNITYKKRMEEERNSLITNLTRTNRELKELTYTTAHDLRAPVNNLLALFSILNLSKIRDEELLELIEMLKLSTDGLKNTLDNYVDNLSQNKVLNVPVEVLDLKIIFDRVQGSIKTLIDNSETVIVRDFSAVAVIQFNEAYLKSIFLNLITNSIKYSKPNQPARIKVHSERKSDIIQIIFEDNGLGFDMEKVGNKVFGFKETFHTNNDSKGIGLYLIYNHITTLGGKIEIESQPNQGSKFIISFKG